MTLIYELVEVLEIIRKKYHINKKIKYGNDDNPCYKGVCFISSKIIEALKSNKMATKNTIDRQLFLEIEKILQYVLDKNPHKYPEKFFLTPIAKILEKRRKHIFNELSNNHRKN